MTHGYKMIRNVGKGWFSRKEDRGKKLVLSSLMAPEGKMTAGVVS
jgi:hypothetical protein